MKVHQRCSLLLFTLTWSCVGLERLQRMCICQTETKGGERKAQGDVWVDEFVPLVWRSGVWESGTPWLNEPWQVLRGAWVKRGHGRKRGYGKLILRNFHPEPEVPWQKRTRVPHVSACKCEVKRSRFYVASLIALAHLTWPANTWLLFSFFNRLHVGEHFTILQLHTLCRG